MSDFAKKTPDKTVDKMMDKMTDKALVEAIARDAAPFMDLGADIGNLVTCAVVLGYKGHEKGWTLKQTIEKGKKL
jgi:hypothetical protein